MWVTWPGIFSLRYMSHCITDIARLLKRCTQGLKSSRISNFYCFSRTFLSESVIPPNLTVSTRELKNRIIIILFGVTTSIHSEVPAVYPFLLYHQCKCSTQLLQYKLWFKKLVSVLTASATLVFGGKYSHRRYSLIIGANYQMNISKIVSSAHL